MRRLRSACALLDRYFCYGDFRLKTAQVDWSTVAQLVERLTWVRRVASSRLPADILYPLLSIGSTQEDRKLS